MWKIRVHLVCLAIILGLVPWFGCRKKKKFYNFPPTIEAVPNLETTVGVSVSLDVGPFVSDDFDNVDMLVFDVTSAVGSFAANGSVYSGVFPTQGNESITFSVKDTFGATSEGAFYVNVSLDAEFSADMLVGTAPFMVTFTDDTLGDIGNWEWYFDADLIPDAGTPSAAWTYNCSGTYTVELVVTGTAGIYSDTEIKNDYIVVGEAPVADFYADEVFGVGSLLVNFTDNSSGDPTAWEWDFDGNGSTDSTERNPSYLYAQPGWYTVILTASRPGSSSTLKRWAYIQVSNGDWYVDENVAASGDGQALATAFKTIQEGLDAGNNYDIVLVAPGVYLGNGNKDLDFAGKSIFLGALGGNQAVTIDCENSGRGFSFDDGETADAIVFGFNVQNGNTSFLGGGVYCFQSMPTFVRCIFGNNSATLYGGGVFCEGDSKPTFISCIIAENIADYGAGVYCLTNSSPTIINSAITDNVAPNFVGGGICCEYNSNPTIVNCTITNNNAALMGGGLWCDFDSSPVLKNTILWGNNAPNASEISFGDTLSSVNLYYCDYDDNTGCIGGAAGVVSFDNNCINEDPLFIDEANGDYQLQGGSPCIDTGNNFYATSTGLWEDLALNPRIVDGKGSPDVDIGAYEYQP